MRMRPHPVEIQIHSPARFDRLQILVRLVLALALAYLGLTLGWIGCALYLVLPAVAAVFVSARGSHAYLAEVGPSVSRVLAWLVGFHAYMLMVIDRPQISQRPAEISVVIHPGGVPSVQAAVVRLLFSLPAALLLAILLVPAALFAALGVVTVLLYRTQLEPLLRFQRAIICYAGRLAAYHAALVDTYPSFTFEDAGPGAIDVAAGAR